MKAIIFDLDGTLYDKSGLVGRLVWSQLRRGTLSLLKREREVRKELRGQHFESEEAFYEAFFARFDKPERARRWYFEQYMPDMVSALRQHFRVASWVETVMPALRAQGLKVVVFSDYGSVRKKLEAAKSMVTCPKCGGLTDAGGRFCKNCGNAMDSTSGTNSTPQS